jgi:hypothetical protein
MNLPDVDIIVPVWNSPVETRNCLVNLVAYSEGARLILINNGCDRDTENLMEEFAEALDERALLISSQQNLGFVRAVNRGLARSEADYAVIIRNTSLVTPGWLEPLMRLAGERPDVGLITPRFIRGPLKNGQGSTCTGDLKETVCGDFSAMFIRRSLYAAVGGFDEEMDGAEWCLKDYSRRALRAGYLTGTVASAIVCCGAERILGSQARRDENIALSRAAYAGRWGEERSYCIYFPDSPDPEPVERRLGIVLAGARQGHVVTVMVPVRTHAALARAGWEHRHQNIRLARLPRLFAASGAKKLAAALRAAAPGLVMVSGSESTPFPGTDESIPFAEMERQIAAAGATLYGMEVHRAERDHGAPGGP